MSIPDREAVELFLQEASEHLQYLREYVSVLQEIEPRREDLERLYIAAHTLSGTSASYGFPRFSEVAGKLAHVFQYSLNATLGDDLHGPLTEFLSDGISLLETDLLEISDTGQENIEDIAAFKERYRFAFPVEPVPLTFEQRPATPPALDEVPQAALTGSYFDALPADDEVGPEILEFFQPEAEEHLQVVSDCLISLEGNNNPEEINRLFRAIHTVKGSAAQVGLKRLGAIAHRVEDLIGRLRDGEIEPSPAVVDICLESVDVLKKTLHRQWADESEMRAGVDSLLNRIAEFAPLDAEETLAEASSNGEAYQATPQEIAAPQQARKSGKQPASPAASAKSVRIALERLDRMMNTVGELVINRTRMVGRVSELEKLVDTLSFSKERLQGKVNEFQEKYEFNRISSSRATASWNASTTPKRLTSAAAGDGFFDDFSELEMDRYDDFNILSRSMAEISADVNEVLTQLEGYIGRVEGDIDEFTKLAHHLQDEFTAARMVPIGTLYSRLSRAVRDAAQSAGKQVDLDFVGNETELDNNIIQQISDPLVHLVRNSVAHGIERGDARLSAGKPEAGKVSLRAYHRGNHIYIEVEDDGGGIDYERVKQSAVERALVSSETADRLTERDLREMLFHPGFSTAPAKTELAGRGVGLDVVRANLNALNGDVEIESTRGQGTKFTLKVPLTLIISPALFVRCGGVSFALPLAVVEEIRRIRADEIEDVGGKLLTKVRDVVTEVIRLDGYLGLPPLEADQRLLPHGGGQHRQSPDRSRRRRSSRQRRNRYQESRRISPSRKTFPRHDHRSGRQPDLAHRSQSHGRNGAQRAPHPASQRQRGSRLRPRIRSRRPWHDPHRRHRSRRARTRHRRCRRLHQRPQVRRPHARKERLSREARRRRPGSRRTGHPARLPSGHHRPRNAAHDRLRTDGSTAPEPHYAPHTSDGGNLARRSQTSRSRHKRRRHRIPHQTGAGRSTHRRGRKTYRNGGNAPGSPGSVGTNDGDHSQQKVPRPHR